MSEPTTIFPYDLYALLEQLAGSQFTGTLDLQMDGGTTTLYVNEGLVRYARTSQLLGTFPTYLLTERVFTKRTLKKHLKDCTEQGLTLEKYLIRKDQMAAEDLRHLKRDLAGNIFSRAFCTKADTNMSPTTRRTPEYRLPPINPFVALFKCISEHPSRSAIDDMLGPFDGQKLIRGPEFFALFPLFRDHFGRSQVFSLLDNEPTREDLNRKIGDAFTVSKQVFALYLSGMAYFGNEEPRRSVLRRQLVAAESRRKDKKERGKRRARTKRLGGERRSGRESTRPGVGGEGATPGEAARPTTAPGVGGGPRPLSQGPTEDSGQFTLPREPGTLPGFGQTPRAGDLRTPGPGHEVSIGEALIGDQLVTAAIQIDTDNYYQFFGVAPDAPFSRIRTAYTQAWGEFGPENYDIAALTPDARDALAKVQQRIEQGFETLTDLQLRWAHNNELGLAAQIPQQMLETMFRAEGHFERAQVMMQEGTYDEAARTLQLALELNGRDPEYAGYLAWALTCAQMWGQQVAEDAGDPWALIAHALELDPMLESGWVFRGRMCELAEDLESALTCFTAALELNPSNEEALEAVPRLQAAT